MSQPYDRSATANCPGSLDGDLGEFWVEDPFKINWENNLSSYERNRAFLNVGGETFLEISHLTGADSDGDGRACVAADLDGDGQEELIVRQSGGGALLVFENRFPAKNWIEINLRGKASNRLGIGARLVAEVGGRKIVRDQFPVNSYRSQASSRVHFGLGTAEKIDRLTIRWPSGEIQILTDLKAGKSHRINESSSS
ncbi:MAG: CRTAC1 family protein [Akkermansiaceae bacterium]